VYTHPDRTLTGGKFIGTIEPAVNGTPLTETYSSTHG
jgi:hypothetical protein